MTWEHISDHDLERYYLGMVTDEQELAHLEEHILCVCTQIAVRIPLRLHGFRRILGRVPQPGERQVSVPWAK